MDCCCDLIDCSTSISPDKGQPLRVCPNCRNVSVTSGKQRNWLELCCIPVVPLSSSRVWICSNCQWSMKTNQFEPQLAEMAPPGTNQGHYPPQGLLPQPGPYPTPGLHTQQYPPQGGYAQGYPTPGQPIH